MIKRLWENAHKVTKRMEALTRVVEWRQKTSREKGGEKEMKPRGEIYIQG